MKNRNSRHAYISTKAAFNTFILVGVSGFSFRIQLQGSVVNRRTEGYTATATMTKAGFLDVMNQVIDVPREDLKPVKTQPPGS